MHRLIRTSALTETTSLVDAPLLPFRMSFTLRHTTPKALLEQLFPHTVRGALSPEALAQCLERRTDFAESPIKKPIEMAVEIRRTRAAADAPDSPSTASADALRFDLSLRGDVVGVTALRRVDDELFQESVVDRWKVRSGPARRWSVADLDGATVRIRVAYLSFDEINLRRPPAFHDLRLRFGQQTLRFTANQLASPMVQEDPRPLLHGVFFKTLVVEHRLPLATPCS